MKRAISFLLSTVMVLALMAGFTGCTEGDTSSPGEVIPGEVGVLKPQARLRVATTTSLYDTGLWGYLEPIFEKRYNVEVDVLSTGSGIAFEYGKRGDVDVITIHSKAQELQFIADGYGTERVPFAYNYFVIVGPANDPAGIKGMTPEAAFKKLAESKTTPFISRGDKSGTHTKEQAIWKAAGYDYETIRKSGPWYVETGTGKGPALIMAKEKQGYTLSDIGTFLTFKEETGLVAIVDKGSIMLNVYSVIPVNQEKNPAVNAEMARNVVSFLTSPEIQELIGNYGVKDYGISLFTPCADAEPKA